jgi:hypothetical protein
MEKLLSDQLKTLWQAVDQKQLAQFLAVCSSAKTCEIGENLLSIADSISRSEEKRIHAGALTCPPPLQCRWVST